MNLFTEDELKEYAHTGVVPDLKDLIYHIKTHIHGYNRPTRQEEYLNFINEDFEMYQKELNEFQNKIALLQKLVTEHIINQCNLNSLR